MGKKKDDPPGNKAGRSRKDQKVATNSSPSQMETGVEHANSDATAGPGLIAVPALTVEQKQDLVRMLRAKLVDVKSRPSGNLSYAETAKIFNVCPNTIRNWISGKGNCPIRFPQPQAPWPGSRRRVWPEALIQILKARMDIVQFGLDPSQFADLLTEDGPFGRSTLCQNKNETGSLGPTVTSKQEEPEKPSASIEKSFIGDTLAPEVDPLTTDPTPVVQQSTAVFEPAPDSGYETNMAVFVQACAQRTQSEAIELLTAATVVQLQTAPTVVQLKTAPTVIEFATAPNILEIVPRHATVAVLR